MNGYSVEEAAEVLGVPQGRVWELLARGVLAGDNEGGASMRVYLKGTIPAPAAGHVPEEASNGNGNGHSGNGSHGELSPFRELLTEFRNLTERYGQALLALGEARGEVASLRSRVDLLEARIDMRLPMRASSTVAWELPDRQPQPATSPMEPPVAGAPAEEAPAEEAPAEPVAPEPVAPAAPSVQAATQSGRSRRSDTRAAVAGLAEALARAEDPTLSALPGAQEAAEALAALQQQVEAAEPPEPIVDGNVPEAEELVMAVELDGLAATAPAIDRFEEVVAEVPEVPEPMSAPSLTDEVAEWSEPEVVAPQPATEALASEPSPTEPVQPADERTPPDEAPSSPYTTDVIEPDWFADGDFAWLQPPAPDDEPTPDALPVTEHAAPLESEPEPMASSEVEEETGEVAGPAPMEPPDVENAPDSGETWGVMTEQAAAAGPMVEPATEEIQEAFEDAGVQRAEAFAIEPDEPDASPAGDEPRAPEPRSEAEARVSSFGLYRGQPEGPIEAAQSAQPATAVRDEEAVMWLGDEFEAGDLELATPGWRDGGTATPIDRDEKPAPLQLSDAEIEQLASSEGWDEEEVAAIRGLLGRGEPLTDVEPRHVEPSVEEPPSAGPTINAVELPPAEPTERRAIPVGPAVPEQRPADWLQGRRGPAASAYRRLRRIFQG